jgi:hypothetical protein
MRSRCDVFLFRYLRRRGITFQSTRTSISEMLVKVFFLIFIITSILFFILIKIIVFVLHVIILTPCCIESFRLLKKQLQGFDIFIIIFFLYNLLLMNHLLFILIVIIVIHFHGCEISWRAYNMVRAIINWKQNI